MLEFKGKIHRLKEAAARLADSGADWAGHRGQT